MKISEIITDKYKLRLPPTVYYDLLADVAEAEEEQESILDKIRTEIENAVWEDSIYSFDGSDEVRIPRLDPDDVFEIIDKYKAEGEV